MNSLCYCVTRRFANQGAQNLRHVYGSLQRFPCHANPIVTFSHFSGAAKFTDPHFAQGLPTVRFGEYLFGRPKIA